MMVINADVNIHVPEYKSDQCPSSVGSYGHGPGGDIIAEDKKAKRWSDDRIVATVGMELRQQLEMFSEVSGQSLNDIIKDALTSHLKKQGDFKETALRRMAEKMGVSIEIRKAEPKK